MNRVPRIDKKRCLLIADPVGVLKGEMLGTGVRAVDTCNLLDEDRYRTPLILIITIFLFWELKDTLRDVVPPTVFNGGLLRHLKILKKKCNNIIHSQSQGVIWSILSVLHLSLL